MLNYLRSMKAIILLIKLSRSCLEAHTETQPVTHHEVEDGTMEKGPIGRVHPYESEYTKFSGKIRNLTPDEITDLVGEGKNRSFAEIEIDCQALAHYLFGSLKGLSLDILSIPSHDEIAAIMPALADALLKIERIIDQSFTVFENSDKTAPFAEKIVAVLKSLKNEGFVDTSNICEFFKKTLFKYLNDFFRLSSSAPEFIKASAQIVLKNGFGTFSPKVAGHKQANSDSGFYNSLTRIIGLKLHSLGVVVNTYSEIDLSSVVKSIVEIEEAIKEASEWCEARRNCSAAQLADLIAALYSQLSDPQKDLLFEIEKSYRIILNLLDLVYVALKAEYISECKKAPEKDSSVLCSCLYSIPFDRESALALIESPEELSSIAN